MSHSALVSGPSGLTVALRRATIGSLTVLLLIAALLLIVNKVDATVVSVTEPAPMIVAGSISFIWFGAAFLHITIRHKRAHRDHAIDPECTYNFRVTRRENGRTIQLRKTFIGANIGDARTWLDSIDDKLKIERSCQRPRTKGKPGYRGAYYEYVNEGWDWN